MRVLNPPFLMAFSRSAGKRVFFISAPGSDRFRRVRRLYLDQRPYSERKGTNVKKLMALLTVFPLLLSIELCACADGIFDLLVGGELGVEADLPEYYLSEMLTAAEQGDISAGRIAGRNRRAVQEAQGDTEGAVDFDELYLLAKLIYADAGSYWLSEDFRFCVGEVVMNRVASPEFPDSVSAVIYQKGQYSAVTAPGFAELVPPRDCIDIALRLLQGERKMVPSVVFQSNYIQGELFSVYYDWHLGMTYFCVSPNIELYPE